MSVGRRQLVTAGDVENIFEKLAWQSLYVGYHCVKSNLFVYIHAILFSYSSAHILWLYYKAVMSNVFYYE
jgi:hypothetical protein